MTEKEIRDEALRKVMWSVGNTCNDVTRYIADAVAEKVVRDEGGSPGGGYISPLLEKQYGGDK